MREIHVKQITDTVSHLCQEACLYLPDDVIVAITNAQKNEISPVARETLSKILESAEIAAKEGIPLCQDTGVSVVFLELGQEVCVTGGDINTAVDEGVRRGYNEGYLRKSMVAKPYDARVNTRDNTPAVIHTDIVPGDRLKVIVMPKGGGAENMTRLKMLTPAAGREGVVSAVVETMTEAGSNPCPPVIIGVGIGGTAEKAMIIAKKALLRRTGESNIEPEVAGLEKEILERVNSLGIGAMGYGGNITALAVHVEVFPSHIASLPVAINLQCHSARHREAVI